jgi:hypothetical protein
MAARVSYDVELNGPMFDGRAIKAVMALCNQSQEDAAKAGVGMIQRELDRVLKTQPTGRYRRSIKAEPRDGHYVITDGRIVYGPWLEGVGSRNAPVTRFRGYHTFRRMQSRIKRRADLVAEGLLRLKYLRRMQ